MGFVSLATVLAVLALTGGTRRGRIQTIFTLVLLTMFIFVG